MEKWINKFEVSPGKWVYVQSETQKAASRAIIKSLEGKWTPPYFYYHLSRSGGHVAAVNSHIEHKFFIYFDIKSFFSSINRTRVTRVLKKHYPYQEARSIANYSTVKIKNNLESVYILPFGYSQSPYLSAMCLADSKLGKVLESINTKIVKVSVYMDDIIISSDNPLQLMIARERVIEAMKRSNFEWSKKSILNPSKTITVFNILLSRGSLAVTNERMDSFRREYYLTNSPFVKEGIVNYIYSVNSNQVNTL